MLLLVLDCGRSARDISASPTQDSLRLVANKYCTLFQLSSFSQLVNNLCEQRANWPPHLFR